MLLFMFLLMPLVLIGYCFYTKNPKMFMPIFIGLLSAILLCAFKTFFLYAHRIVPYSLGENISYLLVRQSLLPCVVLYGFYILFSKDSAQYKVESLLPLLLSFYMIYLPYSIISTSEGLYSGFVIFIKPILYLFMIVQIAIYTKRILKLFIEKKYFMIVIYAFLTVVFLVLPAIIESLVIIGESMILSIILTALYCVTTVVSTYNPFARK